MELPEMDLAFFASDLTESRERARAAESRAALDELSRGRLDFANPLFTDVWLPLARRICYRDDKDRLAFTADRDVMYKRHKAIEEFSFAIPSYAAISKILEYGTDLVEIGSGLGYWAEMLSRAGGSVTAVERDDHETSWFPDMILADGVQYLREHDGLPHKTLFLCWPALDIDAVLDCFEGDTVVWVGEIDECTCEVDSEDWVEVERFQIPTWPLIHDIMIIYKRSMSASEQVEMSGKHR